ncbi:hypothetical protein G9A89_002376 [Geosiphon pyriformis]|nr:hypothetical protein G9A89_002376 [Geosiphon pyriformis]
MAHVPSVKEGSYLPVSPKNRTRLSKRNRTNIAGSSSTSSWLNVVLNDHEVDPCTESEIYSYQDINVSRHKPVSDIQITTPFVFKPVNPGQICAHGESLRSPGRHTAPFSSTSIIPSSSSLSSSSSPSSSSAFPTPTFTCHLSEEQVIKVVEVLGETLEEIKIHVRRTVITSNEYDYQIPSTFLVEFNKLLQETPLPSPTTSRPPPIRSLDQLRAELSSDVHSSVPSPSAHFYQYVFDFYCQKTAFLSVAHMFFEVVVMDFLCDHEKDKKTQQMILREFMKIFSDEDNFLINRPNSLNNGTDHEYFLDAFMWYYRRVIRVEFNYPCNLLPRLHIFSIRFTTPDSIESILSMFYTKYFLNIFAKEHQKDHGQFYTPREVMRFMWDRVLLPKDYTDNSTWLEKLLRDQAHIYNSTNQNRHRIGFMPHTPRVLDPCMGIGSFLCEFINRLTLAARQYPSVWEEHKALGHLLQSLAKNLWGIEIDSFALHLCKLNIILHLLPLYKQFLQVSPNNQEITLKLTRMYLFRNDTLNLYLPKPELAWEYENLSKLRSPERLKFDYIVTNPPYMIRKTGFISEPDSELFDERVLGKGGMQAYAYFFWFCVERCHEDFGEICLISASQWMGLEFADKLRAWLWQRCHFVEFFQFEPFKVWRKIQTDSLIFRLRRRREIIPLHNHLIASTQSTSFNNNEPSILFLRYMNRKATLQETLQAYSNFDQKMLNNYEKDMHYKLTPPYPSTILPSATNSYSFTFLMPTSAVSAYLHSITVNLPSLCDHQSVKSSWLERNPLIWHRGPNTNPVYALVVRTAWAYNKFGREVSQRWLRPVFYWNGKNGGKEAEFWQKMGDELRLEKKESSPAEAYVPLGVTSAPVASEKSVYSLIMVDRDAVDKVRKEVGEDSAFWYYLREARKNLQTGMSSREIVYCGTSKCGVDVETKIIHPINYGYFSKNQPRQRFFIDENNVCVTNQCIYFTLKSTTPLSSYFFLGLLNSTTIQHFLSHHCKYDQQGRMRLFRESMAKIPYAPPEDMDGANWFSGCVKRMIHVRKMLFEGIRLCDDEDKVSSAVVEKLRRGAWQLTGREWQEKEKDGDGDETSVVLREEQEGNWVMVKKCRGRGDGVEYSLYPEIVPRFDEIIDGSTLTSSPHHTTDNDVEMLNTPQATGRYGANKTRIMKPFFESLLHASACLQYTIDQYVYSLYGIEPNFQIALEEDLKLEIFDFITTNYPRWNGPNANNLTSSNGAKGSGLELRGKIPQWGERLIMEVEKAIDEGQNLLRHKGLILNKER